MFLIAPAGTAELAKLLSSVVRGGCDAFRGEDVHLIVQQVSVLAWRAFVRRSTDMAPEPRSVSAGNLLSVIDV